MSNAEGFFEWLGSAIGQAINFVIEILNSLFDLIVIAGYNFLNGLSHALGIERSWLSMVTLVIGLLLIFAAVKAFIRKSVVGGIILLLLGLWLLSWLIP